MNSARKLVKGFAAELGTSVAATAGLLIVLCGIYPLAVWVVGQAFFPARANGSLILRGGAIAGSHLLAQPFTGPTYFHPRPSAAGTGYDGTASGGTNLGPLSKKLNDDLRQRADQYRAENGLAPGTLVPADAATSSGSGLDPHISVANAILQAPRVARERRLMESVIRQKIDAFTENRDLGILGQPRVNVLDLNLALDALKK